MFNLFYTLLCTWQDLGLFPLAFLIISSINTQSRSTMLVLHLK